MRILLMSASYPPVLGGLQTVVHTLAQRLLVQQHQVQVVTQRHPYILPAQEILERVPIRRCLFLRPRLSDLYRGRQDLFLASLGVYPTTLWRLVKLFQSFRPEVVNIHYPEAQIPYLLYLRRQFSFRLVVSLHGYDILRPGNAGGEAAQKLSPPARQELGMLLQEADAVTACSHYLLDKALEVEPTIAHKGCAIHNGLDSEPFAETARYIHPRPYILAFGRLSHQKGFDLLLKAFAQVINVSPHVDLVLAGEGEDKLALQAQAQRLGLEGRAHWFGRATSSQVVQLLNGSEFVVVPSREEPFGLVALEAMAAGKPVLATQTGGLPEFVQSPGNQLVLPGVEGLSQGLKDWLQRMPEIKEAGVQNRKRAAAYTWEKMVARYGEVYGAL